jgi:hypothetical protein
MSKKKEEIKIGLTVVLQIGKVKHSLTLDEAKNLSFVLDCLIKKEQPTTIPWFPITPPPTPINPQPFKWWDIVYCGDTATITKTGGVTE